MSIRRTAQRAALRGLAKQVVEKNTTFAHMPPSQEETEGLRAAWEKARKDEVAAGIAEALKNATNLPTGTVTLDRVATPGVDPKAWLEAKAGLPRSTFPKPPDPHRTRDLTEATVLALLLNAQAGDFGVGHELRAKGWHPKVIHDRLSLMEKRGLIEYGTALFTPWLSDKGRKLACEQR